MVFGQSEFFLKKTYLPVTLVVCLIFWSCSKDKDVRGDIFLPQDLKTAFYHAPGTYWIIEERATGAYYRDSLFVKSSRLDTVDLLHPGSRMPFARKEVMKVRVAWPFYGLEFELSSESSPACSSRRFDEPCHFVTLEFFLGSQSRGKSRICYFPAEVDGGWPVVMSGLSEPQVRIDTIISSYVQAGNTFRDVVRVAIDSDRSFQGTPSIRHISPEAGIIRWQYPLYGIDWQVIRYKIVPGS